MTEAEQIFKEGSQTYYYSSKFFPQATKQAITTLYAFVRVADDFVDDIPQDPDGFYAFREDYERDHPRQPIVREYHALESAYEFEPSWTRAFLDAMEQDLSKQRYEDHDDLQSYMYGSAEVIGLMITRIFNVHGEDRSARHLGRGMQYINFIRDVAEDQALGRTYIPEVVLEEHGLPALSEQAARNNPEAFRSLIRAETNRGKTWLANGRSGFDEIPWRERAAVATATDMYAWTAEKVARRPFRIYDETIKPSTPRILARGIINLIP